MKTVLWPNFEPEFSRVDLFRGGAKGTFNEEKPWLTFMGVTFRLLVAPEHQGFNLRVGYRFPCLPLTQPTSVYISGLNKVIPDEWYIGSILEENINPGYFQYVIDNFAINEAISLALRDSTIFNQVGVNLAYFVPLLESPSGETQYYLWDATIGSVSQKGFPIRYGGVPEDQLPFIEKEAQATSRTF